MSRSIIYTKNAPEPVGAYNQAVTLDAGKLIFTSGQIAINPDTNEMVTDDIDKEIRQVLDNLKAVLEAGGSDLNNIIKTTVFLKDLNDFAKLNEIYNEYFPENPPARSAVQVSKLPKDVNVEIEAIAIVKS